MRVDERRERCRDERKLGQAGAAPNRHEVWIADARAAERNDGLRKRRAEGENEGEMADLDDHFEASPSCQRPCFFSASTTSRGM